MARIAKTLRKPEETPSLPGGDPLSPGRLGAWINSLTHLSGGRSRQLTRCPRRAYRNRFLFLLLLVEIVVQVDDVSLEIFFQAVLAIGAADSGFAPAGMEALHGLEVLAVHIGLADF